MTSREIFKFDQQNSEQFNSTTFMNWGDCYITYVWRPIFTIVNYIIITMYSYETCINSLNGKKVDNVLLFVAK